MPRRRLEIGFDDQRQRFAYSQRRVAELGQGEQVIADRRRGWHVLKEPSAGFWHAPCSYGFGLS
ncbi:hypothetical protein [Candidatus Nephthysia bennettiae]|uniref:Uncharacterized protein n=1 Tax=Candidatus Nephthysia bennettiae TaxID=3127016 RepID=A0A934K0W9_9BACT|nr:hypothetical protein [Candidatus Dormibacteraeota bacterium]